jgi:hypothetical protein
MPGPTTEAVNEDVKGLRDDLHKVEVSLKEEIHRVDKGLTEVSTQVKGLLTSIKLLAVLAVSTLGASIWWGATLTAELRNLSVKVGEKSQASDARIDKLEASILKALDQAKAKTPPASTPRAN